MFQSNHLRQASLALAAAVALSASLSAAGPASAEVVATEAAVAPGVHVGRCPFLFKFNGRIETNHDGVVKYRWIRSDGAIAPVQTLVFQDRRLAFVSDTWTIGRTYAGWEAVEILSPNPKVSNHADFKLDCKSRLVP